MSSATRSIVPILIGVGAIGLATGIVAMMERLMDKAMMRHAANSTCWALGKQQRNGFHVRKIVWGLEMAKAEARLGEEIRAGTILVGPHRPYGNPRPVGDVQPDAA